MEMDISKLCRSCMCEVALWEIGNFDLKAVEMFCSFTNIEISEEEADELPRQFCYDCTIKTESAYTFKKKAQETDVTLKNLIFRSTASIIVEPKLESDHESTHSIDTKYEETCFYDVKDECENENTQSEYNVETVETSCDVDKAENLNTTIESTKDIDLKNKTQANKANTECKQFEESTQIEKKLSKRLKNKNSSLKRFMDSEDPNSNEKQSYSEQLICKICKRSFNLNVQYQRHMKQAHSKNKIQTMVTKQRNPDLGKPIKVVGKNKTFPPGKEVIFCEECPRNFSSMLWFSRHMKKEHSRIYECRYCIKKFPTYSRLRTHEAYHTEASRFECESCGKKFQKRKQLAAHAVTHGDARPHACSKCDRRFKIKSILTNHMKLHQKEKSSLCNICGKTFANDYSLNVHMRTHSEVKPLQCPQCDFRAKYESTMSRHRRNTHVKEKKQSCPFCSKQFNDKVQLARHKLIHTGEKPYKCPMCSDAFIDSWKRRLHLMRTHKMELGDIPRLNRAGEPAPL